MSPLARIRQVAACLIFLLLPLYAPAADPGSKAGVAAQTAVDPAAPVQLAPKTPASIAHSSLLNLEATAAGDTLQLRIHKVSDKTPVESQDVTVTVDGKSQTVSHEAGGIYEVPLEDLNSTAPNSGGHAVEVIVAHDGIREVLSGQVALAAAPAEGLTSNLKQLAWWVLNIVIVLIAAIAISRRKS